MLRPLLRSQHLRSSATRPQHRYLVSSVLLTRTYENESVAELKKMAKDRGLSQYVFFFLLPVIFILFYSVPTAPTPIEKETNQP